MSNFVLALNPYNALIKIYARHSKAAGPAKLYRFMLPIIWKYEIKEITGKKQGQRTDLSHEPEPEHTQNFAELPKGESREIAAKAVDMNRETYRQAKAVVNSGNQEVIQAMDSE